MYNFYKNYVLVLILICYSISTLVAQADLSLILTQQPATPSQFSVYQVEATLSNDGPEDATGVVVHLPAPAGTVFQGGNEATLTSGTFDPYNTQEWSIPNLASGETATITVNLFLNEVTAPGAYAQVTGSDQIDPDSTPNNGTPPTINEDDEASTLVNGGFVPDLTLSNLQLSQNPLDSGALLDFTFDIKNLGLGAIAQDFIIQGYFSSDDVLSPDDLQNGTVPTGNFAGGQTVSGVVGAAIPAGLSPGEYFFILEADANGQVVESNETNNTLSVPLTIGNGVITTGDIDLSLAIEQSPADPAQFRFYTVTATVSNEGPSTATGVVVDLPRPVGAVYQGGGEFLASQGNLSIFGLDEGEWTVGRIAAGDSAMITIKYYLNAASFSASYAEVIAANETDVDSTPGNGNGQVNEDDEASTGTATGPACELTVTVLEQTCNDQGTATGADDTYTVTFLVENGGVSGEWTASTGGANAFTGVYNVPFDLDGGNIVSANSTGGFQINLTFADNIDVNCTAELTIVPPATTCSTPSPGCAWVDSVNTGYGYTYAVEENGNYLLYGQESVTRTPVQRVYDTDGNFINTSRLAGDGKRFSDGNQGNVGQRDSSVVATIRNRTGDVTNTFSVNVVAELGFNPIQLNTVMPSTIYNTPQGYAILGTYRSVNTPALARGWALQVDFNGNVISGDTLSLGLDINSFDAVGYVQGAGLVVGYFTFSRSYGLLVLADDSSVRWNDNIVGDLVTNRIGGAAISADESLIYLAYRDQSVLSVQVEAFDVFTGSSSWKLSPTGEIVANPTRTFGSIGAPLALENGDVAVLFQFSDIQGPNQTFAARVDNEGNLRWATKVSAITSTLGRPLLESGDGELLFTSLERRFVGSTTVYTTNLIQLTSEGELSPVCGAPQGVDLELTLSSASTQPAIYEVNYITVDVTNTGTEPATGVVVDVPLPADVVYTGGNEFTATQGVMSIFGTDEGVWHVGSLSPGQTATLVVNYFSLSSTGYVQYAEVLSQNEQDLDSAPGNGTGVSVEEDDEGFIRLLISASRTAQLITYPNPVAQGEQVVLRYESSGEVQVPVVVSDLNGREVYRTQVQFYEGLNNSVVDIQALPSGVYVLAIPGRGLDPVRLVIQRD